MDWPLDAEFVTMNVPYYPYPLSNDPNLQLLVRMRQVVVVVPQRQSRPLPVFIGEMPMETNGNATNVHPYHWALMKKKRIIKLIDLKLEKLSVDCVICANQVKRTFGLFHLGHIEPEVHSELPVIRVCVISSHLASSSFVSTTETFAIRATLNSLLTIVTSAIYGCPMMNRPTIAKNAGFVVLVGKKTFDIVVIVVCASIPYCLTITTARRENT